MGIKISSAIHVILLICLSFFISACATHSKTTKEYSNTEKARMLVEVANGALMEGDPTGALQSLAHAEHLDSKLPELYHSKALAFFAKRELVAAVESAKKAVQIYPAYSDANNTLGKLLLDLGHYQDAVGPLTTAAHDPLYRDAYKAWTNLGILKYKTGEYISSEAYLTRAILDAPKNACVAYYYRGRIKEKDMRMNEAISDLSQALKRNCAKFTDAQWELGLAYQKNRQFEEARRTFIEIQKLYPNTSIAKKALSQLKMLP